MRLCTSAPASHARKNDATNVSGIRQNRQSCRLSRTYRTFTVPMASRHVETVDQRTCPTPSRSGAAVGFTSRATRTPVRRTLESSSGARHRAAIGGTKSARGSACGKCCRIRVWTKRGWTTRRAEAAAACAGRKPRALGRASTQRTERGRGPQGAGPMAPRYGRRSRRAIGPPDDYQLPGPLRGSLPLRDLCVDALRPR